MGKTVINFLVFILMTVKVFAGIEGEEIAKQVQERYTGDDAVSEMQMIFVTKKDKKSVRKLFIKRKKEKDKDQMLLKFTYPSNMKGTAFMAKKSKGKDVERFLYMPVLGRVRRIASSDKNQSFVGSDFSYEDISGRDYKDYTYNLVNENEIYKDKNCYVLEYYAKDNDKIKKIMTWINKETFIVLKAEYYDYRDKKIKQYEVNRIEKENNIWTIYEHTMINVKTGHKTIILIDKVSYNQNLPVSLFNHKKLRR